MSLITICTRRCTDNQKNDAQGIAVRCYQNACRIFYFLPVLIPQRQAGQRNLNEWRPNRKYREPEVKYDKCQVCYEHSLPNKSLRQLHAHREDQKDSMRNGNANFVPEAEHQL